MIWPAFEETPEALRDEVGAILRLNQRLSRGEPSELLAERIRLFEQILGELPDDPELKSTDE